MATIGTLNAKLILSAAGFVGGMRKAIAQTSSFTAMIKRSALSVARFSTSLVGIGSISAAVYSMSRVFKTFGDLADISDMLNINTQSLIGFRLAAEEAGVSAEDLETSIRFLLKTVGEQALANGRVAGLNARSLLGLPTEEIVLRIADALSRIPDRASRAAAEVKALGRAGARLDIVFIGGRKGLEKFIEITKGLGTALNRIDVGKLDLVSDDMHRLSEAFKGFWATLAVELAEPIDEQITTTTLGVKFLTVALKNLLQTKQKYAHDVRVGRPDLLTQKVFWSMPNYERYQRLLMGPPAPFETIESDFARRVREDMEKKSKRAGDGEGEHGRERGKLGVSGFRIFDVIDIALNSAHSAETGLRRLTKSFDTSLSSGMGNRRYRDNPLLDRIGRDLHDVLLEDLEFRKEHGGRGRTGEDFGANILGWRNPDFPKGVDKAMVRQEGILSEMRLIREEGDLSRSQLRAQLEMVQTLKRIEKRNAGMAP